MAGDNQGHLQHSALVPQTIKNAAGPSRKGIQPFQRPVGVGGVPGRWGWGLISVVTPFPALTAPGSFAQVEDFPPVPSLLLRANTRAPSWETFPEITLMLVQVNPNSLPGPGKGSLSGARTIPISAIHVPGDCKITPSLPSASWISFLTWEGRACPFPAETVFVRDQWTEIILLLLDPNYQNRTPSPYWCVQGNKLPSHPAMTLPPELCRH